MVLYGAKSKKGQGPTSAELVETLLTFLKQLEKPYNILDELDKSCEQKEILHIISRIDGGCGCSVNILITAQISTAKKDTMDALFKQLHYDTATLISS